MLNLEQSLLDRYPRLAPLRRHAFAAPVLGFLRRVAAEDRVNHLLEGLQGRRGLDFVTAALAPLRLSYTVSDADRENIPARGPVVIVANRPLGSADALALLDLVGSVRADVRILSDALLGHLEPLSELLIRVAPGRGFKSGLRAAYRALEQGAAVILFPAGAVSRLGATGLRDGRWRQGFARLALRTGAPVLPIHLGGRNSSMFYGVSSLARPLAEIMLSRELIQRGATRIPISVGEMVAVTELRQRALPPGRLAARMRRHVYRLPQRRLGVFQPLPPVFRTTAAIAQPESVKAVTEALALTPRLGETSDGKAILLYSGQRDDVVMRELGRLRELSFRQVGEGTGRRRDLDAFDDHYRHLLLWNETRAEIVGAYRLGEGAEILARRGLSGFYSHTLFHLLPGLESSLGQSVEMGRSFVQPAYWGSRSLDYLWQGIGAYLRGRPEVRYVFGPVSMSASLPPEARDWIVHFHQHFFGTGTPEALARRPYRLAPAFVARADQAWHGLDLREAQKRLKETLAGLGAVLPTLYRQYVDLCEPEGVRFLGFSVDPDFGHCVDGLVRLDLARLKPAKRERYLGLPEPGRGLSVAGGS